MTEQMKQASEEYAQGVVCDAIEELKGQYGGEYTAGESCVPLVAKYFLAGAEWYRNNIWKDAQGDDLPELDREVIALTTQGKVVFAHRPKETWTGRNIITGEVKTYEPVRYDVGGWNQPDVKYWLDIDLPKKEEE